jgi:hypothetical protein
MWKGTGKNGRRINIGIGTMSKAAEAMTVIDMMTVEAMTIIDKALTNRFRCQNLGSRVARDKSNRKYRS